MGPMNIKIRLLTLATATALCASTALASEIYRQIDADGNVLYADIPTGDPGEELLAVTSRSTDDVNVQAHVQASQEARKANAQRKAEQKARDGDDDLTRGEKRDEDRIGLPGDTGQCQQRAGVGGEGEAAGR